MSLKLNFNDTVKTLKDNKKLFNGWGRISHKVHNNILHFLLTISLCLLGFTVIPNNGYAEIVDRIVAVVNNDIITLMELNEAISPYEQKIKSYGYPAEKERQMMFKLREDQLDQLISLKLADQEAKQQDITVTEKEIDDAIERIKEANFMTDENLRAALAQQGSSMEQLRDNMKKQVLKSKLVNFQIKSKIVITREDISAYYEKHKDQYTGKKKYHLRNILIKAPGYATEEEKKEIRKRMEAVMEKLQQGKSFEKMAELYSESPLSTTGGDLGEIEIDIFSKQLKDAIEGLQAGEYTSIIDTDQGYQTFYVEKVIEANSTPLDEVSLEIEEKLYNEIVDQKFQTWLKDLRKQAHVKVLK